MENALQILAWPPIHFIACAMPMIIVHNGPALHQVMSDRFKIFMLHSLPVALLVALGASMVHPWRIAMGVAIMFSHLQWFALNRLYRRFENKNGRLPLTMMERDVKEKHSAVDVAFGFVTSATVIGVPLVTIAPFIWLAQEFAKN